MSFIKKEISIKEIKQLEIPIDSLNMLNLFKYKYLISDWSGAFIEYAMIFKRKAFLINTPKKILNLNYLKYENKPIEITLRNILGKTYDIENIKEVASLIKILSQEKDKRKLIEEDEVVEKIISENFFI